MAKEKQASIGKPKPILDRLGPLIRLARSLNHVIYRECPRRMKRRSRDGRKRIATSWPLPVGDGGSGTPSDRKPQPIDGAARIWPNGIPTSDAGAARIEIELTGFCGPSEPSAVMPITPSGAIIAAET